MGTLVEYRGLSMVMVKLYITDKVVIPFRGKLATPLVAMSNSEC